MIDVTVKTLDSQNHKYNVPDDITVRQFKERIASSVCIPSDKQRLIYCGRVLQDEKKLSEYNVHEKVIHLVMRAPFQSNLRGSSTGTTNTTTSSPTIRPMGRTWTRGAASATQGPSSSGVRLNQAKSMLDRAAEVIVLLENRLETNTTQTSDNAEDASQSSTSGSTCMDQSASVASRGDAANDVVMEESNGATAATNGKEKSKSGPSDEASSSTATGSDSNIPIVPQEEMEAVYSEIDTLNNNMDPNMLTPGQVIHAPIIPMVGTVNSSLAGGLAQAASAAFASALSSFNSEGGSPGGIRASTRTAVPNSRASSSHPDANAAGDRSSTSTGTRTTSSTTTTGTSNSPRVWITHGSPSGMGPGSFGTFSLSRGSPSNSGSPSPSRSSARTPASSSTSSTARQAGNTQSPSGDGVSVRITNRVGLPRGMLLEHPPTSTMATILERYRSLQRRLEPFLDRYHQTMLDDRAYEAQSPQMTLDQWTLWRVSESMHYLSHAMHALSDIIVDLRREPPRQLRARPIIIQHPAIVQAQINVSTSDSPMPTSSSSTSSSSTTSTASTVTSTTSTTSTSANPPTSTSIPRTQASPSRSPFGQLSGMPPGFLNIDGWDGGVLMHVGPNVITIDQLQGGEGESGGAAPELIQNLVSSITSQLGMDVGGINMGPPSSQSQSAPDSVASSNSAGTRLGAAGQNSQATGSSGTNTTSATNIRVTPRPQVQGAPLHVPGMGMNQFDPFLPCQSHHLRISANTARRRHQAQPQAGNSSRIPSQTRARQRTAQTTAAEPTVRPVSRESTAATAPPPPAPTAPTAPAAPRLPNLLGELFSSITDDQGDDGAQQRLIRNFLQVMTSMGSTGSSQNMPDGTSQIALGDYLQELLTTTGVSISDQDPNSLYTQLFNTVFRNFSMGDFVQLIYGDIARVNRLFTPLRDFIRTNILENSENSSASMERGLDNLLSDIRALFVTATGNVSIHEGMDGVNSIYNFMRQKLEEFINFILNHGDEATFGSSMNSRFYRIIDEFLAMCMHLFRDEMQGLEALLVNLLESVMTGINSASFRYMCLSMLIMHVRQIINQSNVAVADIRSYIVSPAEGRRMETLRQQRMSPIDVESSAPSAPERMNDSVENSNSPIMVDAAPISIPTTSTTVLNSTLTNGQADDFIEAMEVDDVGCLEEEVSTTLSNSNLADVPPQSWHSAVPQDWIPVITRDAERQRRGVPDSGLSDAYLCGMPLKRRKIHTQNRPQGLVQNVMQDTLRQSLRSAGVARPLVDSVSSEASVQLNESFGTHVRSELRQQLEDNTDFTPEKFPQSEKKIRKK